MKSKIFVQVPLVKMQQLIVLHMIKCQSQEIILYSPDRWTDSQSKIRWFFSNNTKNNKWLRHNRKVSRPNLVFKSAGYKLRHN